MKIKQISVFLENKPGRLADATKVLADAIINIRALSIADTADFGILRIIVDKPDDAYKILRDNHFTVSVTDVIGVEMADQPGGLNKILSTLGQENINIEYMYAFIGKCNNGAFVVLRVGNTDEAIAVLGQKGFKLLEENSLYHM